MNQEHLDADVVAAWAEGSIDPSARAAAEAHAADCERCQAVLAAMARTDPVEVAPRAVWLRTPIRWLVPLATAAAALTVWVLLWREPMPPATPQLVSRTESAPAPDRTQPLGSHSPAPVETKPAVPGERGRLADAELGGRALAQRPAAPAAKAGEPRPVSTGESVTTRERSVRVDDLSRDAAAGARVVPPPPASAPSTVQTQTRPPSSPPVQRQASPTPADTRQTQSVQQAPAAQQAGAAGQAQQQPPQAAQPAQEPITVTSRGAEFATDRRAVVSKPLAAAQREVVSPDPAVRWRFGADGVIQQSANGGRTWVAQASGVTVELTAASAPSPRACWIVGRSGTVLLTTDASTWRRVTFPLPVDLRGVTATDATRATVTTADGRVFRTIDGGASWRQ